MNTTDATENRFNIEVEKYIGEDKFRIISEVNIERYFRNNLDFEFI